MKTLAPRNAKNRFDVYRFFNGLSDEAKEGLDSHRLRTPLVKTFLLEHVACREGCTQRPPAEIFRSLGASVDMLDEHFMGLSFEEKDPENGRMIRTTTGYLEEYDPRFFAYYTCEDSKTARQRVSRWILNPDLDSAWFSSPLLQNLWDRDVAQRGDQRFSRLTFRHESIFEMPDDCSALEVALEESEADPANEDSALNEEERPEFERRNARFVMGDSIGRIKGALKRLQENYAPLHVLHALRFPSPSGRGGHELNQSGQITNRSDSFEEHRNIVRYLYRIYSSILSATESSAWQNLDKENRLSIGMRGVPLIIRFDEPLSEATFNQWVDKVFQKRNRFKLWGNPIRLGPRKVHVYGADRHLWQPIHLELTAESVVAILPRGTCGNTFHRLVTNVQHYVCPKIQVWLGDQPFQELVNNWPDQGDWANED